MIEKQEVKSVSWCDSSSQIAKCLTKVGASSEKTSPCFERGRQINQLQKQKFALIIIIIEKKKLFVFKHSN